MYLKSIEVQGFKSFANKILFEFHKGITAIVGPNGSGKSNVADAVRWVLGEQSAKQLRGGNMQDVIFAGTETRRPLSFAYVAITLDNSDHKLDIGYEEVTVARRLYRSGESEYMINGAPCRLRDINELFYDTGIGKEGYSIIGQGQIDRILSTRPEETRELFDEATGIVRFKRRKNEAQKKLADERQNILRISDIISELERQIGPLEKQSAKAKEYLRLKEELKSCDVNLFLMETERLDAELSDLETKASVTRAELKETEEACDEMKRKYLGAEDELTALDERLDEVKQELSDTALKSNDANGRIELLRERIRSAAAGADRISERLSAIEKSLAEKEQSSRSLQEEKDALTGRIIEASALSGAAAERLNILREKIGALNIEAEENRTEMMNLLNERASSKGKMQRLDATREQLELRKAELTAQLSEQMSIEAKKQAVCDDCSSRLEDVCARILDVTAKRDKEEKAYTDFRETLGRLNTEIEERQKAYHQESSRLESMKNMAERYEGYGSAIRRVMERKAADPRIHGVVADLFRVDEKYETAIETALGGSIRNIVTENEDTAKELIAYLKKNRFGRVTFLPLESICSRDTAVKKEVLSQKGVIGVASSLVSTDEKYKKVADFLLGRVIVVENVDEAARIARKYGYSLHIVTPEGEYLRPGGSMTGGAYKNSDNLLGRRREIEELTRRVKELSADLEASRGKMEEVKEKRRLCRAKAGELETKLSELFLEQNTAKLNVDQANKELSELRGGYEGLRESIAALDAQLEDLEKSRESLNIELEKYDGRENDIKEREKEIQQDLDAQKSDESRSSGEAEELRLKEAALIQKSEFLQENLDRLKGEEDALLEEKEELDLKAREGGEDVKAGEDEIAALTEELSVLAGLEKTLRGTEEELKNGREELSGRRKKYFDGAEELLQKKNLLDKEMLRQNSRKEKLEESAEAQADYMWREYELTYNSALPLKNSDMGDRGCLKKQSAALKDEIKKLGDVNVNAIEDYRTISERYSFMSAQMDDLAKSEEALNGIIASLDAGMRRQFETEFARLGDEFDKAFKELFGGGKGTLEIDTEADILEAGVRIIACPPGKKLQNMMQLSGGEKALTAIALLFAIQNMKPSPFCLLDEIEAALDDSNVGRFSRYLHKLTKNTQFIIITHRKGTMESADRLYGITMQEKGVSIPVSVNLIEEELDA